MHFNGHIRGRWLGYLMLGCLGWGILTGCKDNTAEQGDVFDDVQQRVVQTVLPELNAESQAVLRNLVNLSTVFPEVCKTPLAELGSFTSSLPALKQPPSIVLDDRDGEWVFSWSNVIFGDDDTTAATAEAVPVDFTMTVMFRSEGEQPLRAVPFSLMPRTALQTVGVPPSFTAATTEGFFLYQDADTGAWVLRWRAVGGDRTFSGTIDASTGVSRLMRHLGDPNKSVSTLNISGGAQQITFSEPTTAGNDNGFTFYVRPGDSMELRLRLGSSSSSLRDITINELRIGAGDALLPTSKVPGDFFFSSSIPVEPTGDPQITALVDRGTFLWQDTTTNTCAVGEDQWRLRVTTPGNDTFSGEFIAEEDGVPVLMRAITSITPCPTHTVQRQGRAFSYTCAVSPGQIGGYDVCVPAGTRVTADTLINEVRDPALAFVGAGRVAPPSPAPFSIRFDVQLEERNSARKIKFSEAPLILRGNNDDTEGAPALDSAQVSFEPPCVDGKRLLARLTERGDYSTERFEGGRFIMDNVEFLNNHTDPQLRRFPTRGIIQLDTRFETEDTEIKTLMDTIQARSGQIGVSTIVLVTVNKVFFTFPNQSAVLTID